MSNVALVVCDYCMTAEFVPERQKPIWQTYHQHDIEGEEE